MSVVEAHQDYLDRNGPRVLEVVRSAAGRTPSLDARLADAGVTAADADLADLDRISVLSKDSLPAVQAAHPPLGGLLADGAAVVRLFASPGPIYEPQLAGSDPWGWRPALEACGIGPDDVVLNCFSYHLSPAGAMFDEACRAVGATVVPGGVGAPEVQAQVAYYFGEAPANPKACDLITDDPTHCDTYKATDADFYESVSFWATPRSECLDGSGDECVPFSDWIKAWTEIKG